MYLDYSRGGGGVQENGRPQRTGFSGLFCATSGEGHTLRSHWHQGADRTHQGSRKSHTLGKSIQWRYGGEPEVEEEGQDGAYKIGDHEFLESRLRGQNDGHGGVVVIPNNYRTGATRKH